MDFQDFGLFVGRYNSSLPTLSDGAASTLQLDSNGRLLVQADVTVLIDTLGLNGAADNANILIVGTEDGTGSGTKHVVKLESDGRIIISDGGSSITVDASDLDIRDLSHSQDSVKVGDGSDFLAVNADGSINITDNGGSLTVDATDLDIRDLAFATDKVDVSGSSNVAVTDGGGSLTVDASDLDIRDLSHAQDSVKVGDGTDFLAINSDGSINVQSAVEGSEQYRVTDQEAIAGDGLATITASGTPWVDVASYSHTSGTAHIYGYEWACDANAACRLITDTAGDIVVYKHSLNSTSAPTFANSFSKEGRIEIAGAASRTIKLQIKKRASAGGDALGSASLHMRTIP